LRISIVTSEDLVFGPFDRSPFAPCPLGVTGVLQAVGVGTHMGKVTGQLTDCPNVFVPPGTPFIFEDGEFTLTAANGDEVSGTYRGELHATPVNGLFVVKNGQFTITGGTGRFAGAQGGGVLTGGEIITPGDFTDIPGAFILTGTIILPKR
jgi:hypothetical protein